jgi:energy-coupling factor transporter ATP-binding protein EcfA2
MIALDGVSKSYRTARGRQIVLDDASAVFATGCNFGVLGANGAGKSTLIRLLAGSEMPDRGTIRRDGRVSFPLGFGGTFHGSLSRYYGAKDQKRSRPVRRLFPLCVALSGAVVLVAVLKGNLVWGSTGHSCCRVDRNAEISLAVFVKSVSIRYSGENEKPYLIALDKRLNLLQRKTSWQVHRVSSVGDSLKGWIDPRMQDHPGGPAMTYCREWRIGRKWISFRQTTCGNEHVICRGLSCIPHLNLYSREGSNLQIVKLGGLDPHIGAQFAFCCIFRAFHQAPGREPQNDASKREESSEYGQNNSCRSRNGFGCPIYTNEPIIQPTKHPFPRDAAIVGLSVRIILALTIFLVAWVSVGRK